MYKKDMKNDQCI